MKKNDAKTKDTTVELPKVKNNKTKNIELPKEKKDIELPKKKSNTKKKKKNNKKNKTKTYIILSIITFLLLVLLSIGAYYYFVNNEEIPIFKEKEIVYNVSFQKEAYYVGIEENINININNEDNVDYKLSVASSEYATSELNTVKGLKPGETELVITLPNNKEIKSKLYIVKGIVPRPTEFNKKKEYVSCNSFTSTENKLIDDTLQDRLNDVVYPSRASAVEAARFLTLSFGYRIAYFYENGRLKNYPPAKHIDGEGRYYHKGLYLSSEKYNEISDSLVGPAAWGCKLKNFEDKENFGYYVGQMRANGLDCSGFISWVLYNGGFDVGDVGAGDLLERDDDLYDLGEKRPISLSLLNSGEVKVGDLIAYFGHMAMIVGIDENKNLYVAESLPYLKGVVIKKYTQREAVENFANIMLMDSVYGVDGNLTNMWY